MSAGRATECVPVLVEQESNKTPAKAPSKYVTVDANCAELLQAAGASSAQSSHTPATLLTAATAGEATGSLLAEVHHKINAMPASHFTRMVTRGPWIRTSAALLVHLSA